MTRINCCNVVCLSDSHLLAEYREITRVSKLSKHITAPREYTMGTGHIKFFYNKGAYLAKRTEELYKECIRRGFKVTYKEYTLHANGLNNDWTPNCAELQRNLDRIREKFQVQVHRYRGEIT